MVTKKKKTDFLPRKFHWRHLSSTFVSVFCSLFSFFCFQFGSTAENIKTYLVQFETDINKPINYSGIYFLQIMFKNLNNPLIHWKKDRSNSTCIMCLVSIASDVILHVAFLFLAFFSLTTKDIWKQHVCRRIYIAEDLHCRDGKSYTAWHTLVIILFNTLSLVIIKDTGWCEEGES